MRIVILALALAGCLIAGCGQDKEKAQSEPASMDKPVAVKEAKPAAEPAKKKRGTFVKVRKTRYGKILTNGKGRALYLFDKEKTKRPECYGACAKAWPPFYARGKLKAGKGVKKSRLGVTIRREKRSQVTYKGHPLYYYVTDKAPGQVTCQNVDEFGGLWLVVAPSGNAIR